MRFSTFQVPSASDALAPSDPIAKSMMAAERRPIAQNDAFRPAPAKRTRVTKSMPKQQKNDDNRYRNTEQPKKDGHFVSRRGGAFGFLNVRGVVGGGRGARGGVKRGRERGERERVFRKGGYCGDPDNRLPKREIGILLTGDPAGLPGCELRQDLIELTRDGSAAHRLRVEPTRCYCWTTA